MKDRNSFKGFFTMNIITLFVLSIISKNYINILLITLLYFLPFIISVVLLGSKSCKFTVEYQGKNIYMTTTFLDIIGLSDVIWLSCIGYCNLNLAWYLLNSQYGNIEDYILTTFYDEQYLTNKVISKYLKNNN